MFWTCLFSNRTENAVWFYFENSVFIKGACDISDVALTYKWKFSPLCRKHRYILWIAMHPEITYICFCVHIVQPYSPPLNLWWCMYSLCIEAKGLLLKSIDISFYSYVSMQHHTKQQNQQLRHSPFVLRPKRWHISETSAYFTNHFILFWYFCTLMCLSP